MQGPAYGDKHHITALDAPATATLKTLEHSGWRSLRSYAGVVVCVLGPLARFLAPPRLITATSYYGPVHLRLCRVLRDANFSFAGDDDLPNPLRWQPHGKNNVRCHRRRYKIPHTACRAGNFIHAAEIAAISQKKPSQIPRLSNSSEASRSFRTAPIRFCGVNGWRNQIVRAPAASAAGDLRLCNVCAATALPISPPFPASRKWGGLAITSLPLPAAAPNRDHGQVRSTSP